MMAPRLPSLPRLGTTCLRQASFSSSPFLPITQKANLSLREKKRKAKQDPYAWQQAQLRKNANMETRTAKEAKEAEEAGHPIWGKPTPFIESLDSAGQEPASSDKVNPETGLPLDLPTSKHLRNYFTNEVELEKLSEHAYALTKPMLGVLESQLEVTSEEERTKRHNAKHAKAMEVLKRITSMDKANAKDRLLANKRRIIEEFGRHRTDKFLEPRPESIKPNTAEMPGRAGPDTGSSEVQIAILTTKIRALAQVLETGRHKRDKMNKRNLRLLLHRRQKLLKYMQRKEKGSGRWHNTVEKLGLTPATWQGQIEV